MEFTLSRVVLGACGLLLLASVLPAVNAICDDRETASYQEQCDSFAELIDTFYLSRTESVTICADNVLPDRFSTFTLSERSVALDSEKGRWVSGTDCRIGSAPIVIANNDMIRMTKYAGGVSIEKI